MLLQGAVQAKTQSYAGCCCRVLLQGATAGRDSELRGALLQVAASQGSELRCCCSLQQRVLLQGAAAGWCCRSLPARWRLGSGAVVLPNWSTLCERVILAAWPGGMECGFVLEWAS